MQANRHMGASGGEGLIAKLVDFVEDHWYAGRAEADITFDPSAPESNPFVRGYTRSSRPRMLTAVEHKAAQPREADRAA